MAIHALLEPPERHMTATGGGGNLLAASPGLHIRVRSIDG